MRKKTRNNNLMFNCNYNSEETLFSLSDLLAPKALSGSKGSEACEPLIWEQSQRAMGICTLTHFWFSVETF